MVAPGLVHGGRRHVPLPHREARLWGAAAQGALAPFPTDPSDTDMQPGSALLETLGFIAAILTTLSSLPESLCIRRLGSADDVSLTMYLMMVTGQGLWLIYGIVTPSPSMSGANVVSISFVVWVLVMKLQHLRRLRAMPPLSAPAPAPAE